MIDLKIFIGFAGLLVYFFTLFILGNLSMTTNITLIQKSFFPLKY